ncbi:hypothetical protein N7448_009664 [Penicillium atrosanguineum]|uniref:Uncharacterized protein n=1 Tax=Penicillium atrosanguineum TaxID=1132637 RepID=A0A9W9PZD0_9EURO|nr:uncharacterized protein N7443_006911 [Penicillium atrosanguineum]KAJ5123567.1 hypothetical protein N7448_009664 [Penicillium atrosanguineum]KAJ5142195.1 hypothetical protein N7526_003190 [Penicillium atrosanguineum]KAJ5298791.1 hypothetical protein N7443_006911 [Penicillium atrosanguineum]KAJ5320944.1 hypothetical protein N7476_003946 [Penicillium atrosanguineum]
MTPRASCDRRPEGAHNESIAIHHTRRSINLPRLTACAGIAVARAVKKKSPSAVYFNIDQLTAFFC